MGTENREERNRKQEDERAKSIPACHRLLLQGLKDDVLSTLDQEIGRKVSFTSALSATQPAMNVAAVQQFKLSGLRSATSSPQSCGTELMTCGSVYSLYLNTNGIDAACPSFSDVVGYPMPLFLFLSLSLARPLSPSDVFSS